MLFRSVSQSRYPTETHEIPKRIFGFQILCVNQFFGLNFEMARAKRASIVFKVKNGFKNSPSLKGWIQKFIIFEDGVV